MPAVEASELERRTKRSWLDDLAASFGEKDGNIVLASVLLQGRVTALLVSALPTPFVGVETTGNVRRIRVVRSIGLYLKKSSAPAGSSPQAM